MRTEIRVVLFSALFVGGLAFIYWYTSDEDAGTAMLGLAAAAHSMLCGVGYYLAAAPAQLRLDAAHPLQTPGPGPGPSRHPGGLMRTEIRVVLFSGLFVGGVAVIYWFTSYEDAGTTMLALAAGAYSMLCGYLFVQARRLGRPRPEDLEDADGSGSGVEEIGYFPAASVWPAAIAFGAVLAALGLVFGYWFLVIAAIFLVGGIAGYAVEAQVPH
ncbi:MAG: cytochrome c oxidase subunit 4 [Actinomycetota bacterium]|nr:cytochrome c oxidase subunit 4 [Actinomycetota bacterium]